MNQDEIRKLLDAPIPTGIPAEMTAKIEGWKRSEHNHKRYLGQFFEPESELMPYLNAASLPNGLAWLADPPITVAPDTTDPDLPDELKWLNH